MFLIASKSKSTNSCANASTSRPGTFASTTSASKYESQFRSNLTEKKDQVKNGNDEIDQDFDIDQISYLDKDMALKKLNEELERKSLEIFKKIEEYSDRSRRRLTCETGGEDAPSKSKPPPLVEDDSINEDADSNVSTLSAAESPSCIAYDTYVDSSRISASKHEMSHSDSFDSIGSFHSLSSKNASRSLSASGFCPSTASSDTKNVDIKARKRLQKATESVVKCLQSKLVSYEGRLSDLHIQFRQKIQENTMLKSKVRALEDDREKLLKSITNLQGCADKSTKAAEIAKTNLNLKMQAFAALKKDIDTLKREQKQKAAAIQNLQTRLNRCLEENERLKNQTRSAQMNMRDKQQDDRGVIDELQQRVCQLEQQKSILNATISKQTGLVKTLRNQKVQLTHILNENKIVYQLSNRSNESLDNDVNT